MKIKVYKLNLQGLKCPIPVLKISKKFKDLKKGDILIVNTDDPKAEYDITELTKVLNLRILKKSNGNGNKMLFRLEKY